MNPKKSSSENLNNYQILDDGWAGLYGSQDDLSTAWKGNNNTKSENNKINVYFRNLEVSLLEHIKMADVVLGCVAWLTNKKILEALSYKQIVSIIVQKEDFLRPEWGEPNSWKIYLRGLYNTLPKGIENPNSSGINWGALIDSLSVCRAWETDAIRCMGNYNIDQNPAFPRMHNKFLIFGTLKNDFIFTPYGVWTGSFNMTDTATRSFENALYIEDKEIVNAYHREWQHIFALSEPLNWEKPWCEPEFRIGS